MKKNLNLEYIFYIKSKYPANVDSVNNLGFIHIPKTGGNLIKNSLGTLSGDSHLSFHSMPPGFNKNLWTFAFTRRPYERCISAYFYLIKGGSRNKSDLYDATKYISPYRSFRSFVIEGGLEEAAAKQIHFLPQKNFIGDDMDFIGKFENIKKDWFKICKENKIYKRLLYSQRNIKIDYEKLIDQDMKRKIYNIYMEDFDKFKYRT